MKGRRWYPLAFAALVCGGAGLRSWLALRPDNLDGDSAVFALMAQRIMERGERFVFMPFNHYAGALAAYAGAMWFKLFGVSAAVFNLTGLAMSCLWAMITCAGAVLAFGMPGLIAAALLALFAPYRVMLFSLYPGGVQAETLLFGSLFLLLVVLRDRGALKTERVFFASAGVVCGAGCWQTPGMAPFVVTALFLTRKGRRARECFVFCAGFMAGYFPALVYNVQHQGATFLRLAGRVAGVDRHTVELLGVPGVWAAVVHRFSGAPAAAVRMGRLFISFAGPLNALILAAACILYAGKAVRERRDGRCILPALMISIVAFLAYYCLFIQEPAERFMLALYVPLPFLAARMAADLWRMRRSAFLAAACAGVAGAHLLTYIPDAGRARGGGYAGLARYLGQRGMCSGFSDYWTAYPVIFESGGEVVLSPTLFDPEYSERFPDYTETVRKRPDSTFIVNDALYPLCAADVRRAFTSLGVKFSCDTAGVFTIFHGLSRKVMPEELDIGRSTKGGRR